MISVIFAQCGLAIHTIGLHICKTFPPNSWFAWWHFVQLSCVCSLAVVRLDCCIAWSCGEHHTTMMRARRALSEAWNHMMVVLIVILPFRCLRRGPSDDQYFFLH